jgi:hypothetical protein
VPSSSFHVPKPTSWPQIVTALFVKEWWQSRAWRQRWSFLICRVINGTSWHLHWQW